MAQITSSCVKKITGVKLQFLHKKESKIKERTPPTFKN